MFLDELKLENSNNLFEETQETHFCEGVDGLFEIALESEMSWNNIVVSTIKEEFIAIKNESTVLMEEAKNNWFSKILAWVKEKAQKVAAFFKSIISRLVAQMTNIEKFVAKHKGAIAELKSEVKVTVYTWKAVSIMQVFDGFIKDVMKHATSAKPNESVDEIAQAEFGGKVSELGKTLAESVRGEKKVEQTLDAGKVKGYFESLLGFKKDINGLKNLQASQNLQLKAMELRAKKGMVGQAKDSEEVTRLKGEITTIKNVNALTDKITGIGISTLNQAIADALAISRAGISASKKKPEATKKESAGLFDLI